MLYELPPYQLIKNSVRNVLTEKKSVTTIMRKGQIQEFIIIKPKRQREIASLEENRRRAERVLDEMKSRTIITKEAMYRIQKISGICTKVLAIRIKILLIRALIFLKKVLLNRKDMDYITFWFNYNDALLPSKTGRAIS